MKRIRLDIGALTASPKEGGKFLFFLYKENMDRCLPISLTPPQMHSVLSVFKSGNTRNLPVHSTVKNILEHYGVELLEVVVARNEEAGNFFSELLLFDGEREFRQAADFIDGIIFARLFGAPIYIDEELMARYSVGMDKYSQQTLDSEELLKKLDSALQEAIGSEEYERAESIKKRIDEIKKGKNSENRYDE